MYHVKVVSVYSFRRLSEMQECTALGNFNALQEVDGTTEIGYTQCTPLLRLTETEKYQILGFFYLFF